MKGLQRSLKRGGPQKRGIIKDTIEVRDVILDVDGVSGIGDAQIVAGDFPEGNILLLGAVAYLTFAGDGAQAGLVDDFDGDYSVGTTADADDALTGTDADIISTTPVGPAVAEVAPVARGESPTGSSILDNTDGSLEVNINLIIDDADISADDQVLTVNGEIYLSYVVLGDD